MALLPNSTITLLPHQVNHFKHLSNILISNRGCLDLSNMGCGKTYTSCAISHYYNLPVLVICPLLAKTNWTTVTKEHNIQVIDIISYSSLRSTTNHQPKHGLLERNAEGRLTFNATDKYIQLIKTGLLLVIDEVQMIKNNTDQFKACMALTNAIHKYGGRSRFILLSATPFEKQESVINILRIMSYIQHPRLYSYVKERRVLHLYGVKEFIDVCADIDRDKTKQILSESDMHPKNIIALCFKLYVSIINPKISSSMPMLPSRADKKNRYCNMTPEESEQMTEAIKLMTQVTKYNHQNRDVDHRKINWTMFTHAHSKFEYATLPLLVRLTIQTLENVPGSKVILFINYIEKTMPYLKTALSQYKPLVLCGDKNRMNLSREETIKEFQEGSSRLLIANVRVGGVSLNLDDQVGNAPRYVFVVPNYSMTDLHQATGRTDRCKTMSDTVIRFVYGKCGRIATNILRALSMKTETLKQVLNEKEILLIGDYEEEIEPDPHVETEDIEEIKQIELTR